ncbi:GGDEF domain-containing protein [Fulvimarina endophytica]|uniref:diguanylate cyclase n=1 Tax=Fulvimarina endophytica TaxID=2293836 RepID=A0A371X1G1_9HYPH|nr:GGDEF domain-containing protein [Fulvimarina endophytica]RFC63073.1 GGDEF domain-containing protein [Fulvimarina endophytica]
MPERTSPVRMALAESAVIAVSGAILSGIVALALFSDMRGTDLVRILGLAVFAPLTLGAAHMIHTAFRVSIVDGERNQWQLRAVTDRLTGLGNRQMLRSAWNSLKRPRRGFVLMVVDADHFKQINDRFGHPVGDSALKAIGHALATSVAKTDTVARLGGEEFAVLARCADEDEALQMAERTRAAVSNLALHARGERLPIAVSIGAVFADKAIRFERLYAIADENCYRSKHAGRNRVTISAAASATKPPLRPRIVAQGRAADGTLQRG